MIYATTGKIGSGKDTVIDILAEELSAHKINVSDIVREEAKAHGISLQREPLTQFTKEKINTHGSDYFIKKAIGLIKNTDSENMVVSGIRSPGDVAAMREAFAENFLLIAVEVDDELRFQRIKKRGSEKDQITYEEFRSHDEQQEKLFQIEKTIGLADFVIDNNGTLEDLQKSLFVKLH